MDRPAEPLQMHGEPHVMLGAIATLDARLPLANTQPKRTTRTHAQYRPQNIFNGSDQLGRSIENAYYLGRSIEIFLLFCLKYREPSGPFMIFFGSSGFPVK
jgi:hypothetical protein